MAEESVSLLYKIKPISDRLPSVKRPEGHVHFRTKMMWVVVVLLVYFVMTNVYIYGLDKASTLDLFAQYRTIMAGSSGSLLQLGIGPIVTASIIMQLFVGAKIIKLDLSNKKDKACYQSVLKLLVIVMILFEAVPQVFGYLVPSDAFTDRFGEWGAKSLIILQLFLGSYIVFLMDELISKWGIGSGISLFIAAGVAQQLFTGTFNWYAYDSSAELSLSNLPAGAIPKALYVVTHCTPAQMSSQGYDIIFLQQPNPMIALIGTLAILLLVAYLESTRIELPLSHGGARGARGKYPLKLMYASNIPVILMSALLANISMVAAREQSEHRILRIGPDAGLGRTGMVPVRTVGRGVVADADHRSGELRQQPHAADEPDARGDILLRHGPGFDPVRQVLDQHHRYGTGVGRQADPAQRYADARIPPRPAYPGACTGEVHPHHHHPVGCDNRSAGGVLGPDRYGR